MKFRLMRLVFSLLLMLSFGHVHSVLAHEGMDHDEGMEVKDHEKGSMMGSMMDKSMNKESDMHVATEEDIKDLPNVGNKFCPISKNPVDDGAMGEAVKFVYNEKIYNLCCSMCVKDFKKNPEKYSKIAEDEAKKYQEKEGEVHEDNHEHEHGQDN